MGQKHSCSYELPHEATKESARKASLDHCIGEATKMRPISQDSKESQEPAGTSFTEANMTEIRLGEDDIEVKEKDYVLHMLTRVEPPEEFNLPVEMRPQQCQMPH
ncbi:hypothetical protein L596_010934 [Steinernema carpocapsae]|uniref:Uncharacterized protein n=1 Tax=Steinernema carpocapsae TaxID=34508 RepID=A0A4U5PKM5_STECR|nr:hypothetical protein L596_010934 [Steinernema carpocapsae]